MEVESDIAIVPTVLSAVFVLVCTVVLLFIHLIYEYYDHTRISLVSFFSVFLCRFFPSSSSSSVLERFIFFRFILFFIFLFIMWCCCCCLCLCCRCFFCLWFASYVWIHIKRFHIQSDKHNAHIHTHTNTRLCITLFHIVCMLFVRICVRVRVSVQCGTQVCIYITKDCFSRLNGIKEVCLFTEQSEKWWRKQGTKHFPSLFLFSCVCCCFFFGFMPPYAFEAMNCFIFATGLVMIFVSLNVKTF